MLTDKEIETVCAAALPIAHCTDRNARPTHEQGKLMACFIGYVCEELAALRAELAQSKRGQWSEELMHRIYNTLSEYANEGTYQGERITGVLAGCQRGPEPTLAELTWPARNMLAAIDAAKAKEAHE